MKKLQSQELFINKELPFIIHIDLNSCFAIIEQQANRLLRGRPVGVAAYDTPRGFVLAASYEAKAKGIKLGVNVQQARVMAPGIVIMTPDPVKYRRAHVMFKEVMLEYTPSVSPKSIDEFVLDMRASPIYRQKVAQLSEITHEVHERVMREIGQEMKARIAERLGEWVTVNVGVAPNRFLAKYAAGFDKPDGMTVIDYRNLRERYDNMALVDLPGINTRYRARLRNHRIYNPLQFLDADINLLRKQVFKGIVGYYWYLRLRGHEIDDQEFTRKSIGHQYALPDKTTDIEKLERLLMKLCEKTGRRLRKNNYYASGIHLYLGFDQYRDGYSSDDAYVKREATNEGGTEEAGGFNLHKFRSWHHGEKLPYRLYTTSDIYEAAKRLLHQAEIPNRVKIMSVHVYGLEPWEPIQTSLFDTMADAELSKGSSTQQNAGSVYRNYEAKKRASDAVDAINSRYGEFVLTPALMMEMQGTILDRVAFGSVRDMDQSG